MSDAHTELSGSARPSPHAHASPDARAEPAGDEAREPAATRLQPGRPSGARARRRQPIEYVPYPPTSLPHRDLLVLEHLPIRRGDRICEVGAGSGATAARIARLGVPEVVGLDVSDDVIRALRPLEQSYDNLEFGVADVTAAGGVADYAGRFDLVFSCDTVEHVTDVDAFFKAVAQLLAPRGRCLITFPNEPPETMHGITRLSSQAELEARARAAGLRDLEIGAARLTRRAAKVADLLGWRPLSAVRRVVNGARRGREGGGADGGPQRFDETSFFSNYELWRRLSPGVNLYWYGVLRLMAGRDGAFEIDWGFRRTPFDDCQVMLRGAKAEPAHAKEPAP